MTIQGIEMSFEPWMVHTGLVILAINGVNLFLFLVARKLQDRTTTSASVVRDTRVTDRQRNAA
jgi:hypothetical protein